MSHHAVYKKSIFGAVQLLECGVTKQYGILNEKSKGPSTMNKIVDKRVIETTKWC